MSEQNTKKFFVIERSLNKFQVKTFFFKDLQLTCKLSRDEDDKEVEDERLPAELTRRKPFGMLSFAKPEPPTHSRSLNKHVTHSLENFFLK